MNKLDLDFVLGIHFFLPSPLLSLFKRNVFGVPLPMSWCETLIRSFFSFYRIYFYTTNFSLVFYCLDVHPGLYGKRDLTTQRKRSTCYTLTKDITVKLWFYLPDWCTFGVPLYLPSQLYFRLPEHLYVCLFCARMCVRYNLILNECLWRISN